MLKHTGFADAFVAGSGITRGVMYRLIIGEKITEIPDDAFKECFFVDDVVFESDVNITRIGNRVFYATKLKDTYIPSSVTSIGDEAFASTDKVRDITFNEPSKLESIGSRAFAGADLCLLKLPIQSQL